MNALINKSIYRDQIITSAMDHDAYTLHMQQVVFELYSSVVVRYEFRSRTDENLGQYAGEIREQVNALEHVQFTDDQLMYLRKGGILKEGFVGFLKHFRFDPKNYVKVGRDGDQLVIEIEGPWLDTIPLEQPLMAIVSEVRNRNQYGMVTDDDVRESLFAKVEHLKSEIDRRGIEDFKFVDMGTRRRISYNVQRDAVAYLAKELPDNFVGTSNYHLAKENGIKAMGTMAHQFIMAHQAFFSLQDHQFEAMEAWNKVYRGNLGIVLPDTITTDVFLKRFDYMQSVLYKGARNDSGDPFSWGEKFINHYQKMDLDPKTKSLIFSNGLNFDRALDIAEYFQRRIDRSFGLGGYITNNLGDYRTPDGRPYKPLDMVIKMVMCNGSPVAKVSDDPGKEMCIDPAYLAYVKAQIPSLKGEVQ